jgi:hypothetical protein
MCFQSAHPPECAHLAPHPPTPPPSALVTALSCLREGLRAAGSDLVVRVGPADFTLAAFTSLVGAGAVVTELEQDTR